MISKGDPKRVSTKPWPETAASNFFSGLMEPGLLPEQLHTQALMGHSINIYHGVVNCSKDTLENTLEVPEFVKCYHGSFHKQCDSNSDHHNLLPTSTNYSRVLKRSQKTSRGDTKRVSNKLWPETAASNFFSCLMEPELLPEQLHTQALMGHSINIYHHQPWGCKLQQGHPGSPGHKQFDSISKHRQLPPTTLVFSNVLK